MRFVVSMVGLFALCAIPAESIPIAHADRLAGLLPSYEVVPELSATDLESGFDCADFTHSFDDCAFAESIDAPEAAPDAKSNSQTTSVRSVPDPNAPVDANGNPIPLERQQPQRILGFMPNFRSVSGGAKPHPPGWKYNFTIATRQATDYSSFIFLGITSLTAEGINEHAALGKGVGGFYAYTWRGFLDKTDGTYLSAWLLPSLLHEDTRNYALGNQHSIPIRELYVISRQGVARTYGGRQTPNIAGLGGKVLTQIVSRQYYPKSATTFPVLAEKFGYSAMRDVIFTSIREFYPDAAAHFIRKHQKKLAEKAEKEAAVQ